MSFWTETEPLSPTNLNNATVPVGGIIMFSGTVGTLPSGWALCDGTSGTPDLRGRFIVGAEGGYPQGAAGGANRVALSEAEMPSHTHSGPSHTHGSGSLSTGSAGSHSHTIDNRIDEQTRLRNLNSTANRVAHAPTSGANSTDTTLSAGAHTHSVSGSTSASGTGSTGTAGLGLEHENRPPFYALAFIQRVA